MVQAYIESKNHEKKKEMSEKRRNWKREKEPPYF